MYSYSVSDSCLSLFKSEEWSKVINGSVYDDNAEDVLVLLFAVFALETIISGGTVFQTYVLSLICPFCFVA